LADKNNKLDELFGASPVRSIKLSYSRVSDFYKNGPQALIKKRSLNNEGVRIGSLVDDLLYSKMVDKKHFNKLYYIYDGAKPSATLGKLVNIIIENKNKLPTKRQVANIVKKNSYWSNIKNPELLNRKWDIDQFWNYLKAFYSSKNKIIVGTEDYAYAEELVNVLLTHPFSKNLFIETENKTTLYQFPIRFKFKGFLLRGILDFIRIDHQNKTVRLIDLKTGKDDPEYFTSAFVKYRYDLQEAVYTQAFKSITKTLKLKNYTLEPFEFLYLSRYVKTPIIYKVPEKWHIAAKQGYTLNGRHVPGLYELIDDIKWHWDNKVFDKSRVLHESNGILNLKDDFINLH